MISRMLAEQVLARALARGGDFADLFVEDARRTSLRYVDGHAEEAVSGRDAGAGVRVIAGENYVYATTCDLSAAGLLECASRAAAAAGAQEGAQRTLRLAERLPGNAHKVEALPFDVPYARKLAYLHEAALAARAVSPLVVQTPCSYADVDQRVLIANSEGLFVQDRRVRCRVLVSAVASDKGENQSGHRAPGAMAGFEFFEGIDPAALGRESAEQALCMLKAPYCPAGVMPVVIGDGFGGVIFHEACGHSLEATSVARGASEMSGKLHTAVAAPCVTAVDDGTLPGAWGSLNIDDEGMPTRRNVLIQDGVLTGYLIDRLGAVRMQMAPTGSGRRESYAYAPTSRMTNTFIAAGQDDPDDMIASMGDGLYAKQMGGGSVSPVTGEFNFSVEEGYLVKGGRIAHPVRGATLIGRGSEVLRLIDRVGRDMRMAQGMCGSVSGSVPTNVGQPPIRVSQLTVGGRE